MGSWSKSSNKNIECFRLVILLFILITHGALLPKQSLNLEEIHLVRCLTYISHNYFAPGRSLVISSPATYGDIQQELIAEFHRVSVWPVVVNVDGNINIPEKTDFMGRDGNNIILIPDGNIKYLHAEILALSLDRENKFTRIWNSEARFIVAGANEISIPQQTEIFEYLSKHRIYNCIIIGKDNYVIDKELSRPTNVNDVDTGMKLGVYTWFPYQSSDRCTEVNNITLLDSWVISAQGHINKNTDLFPRKINNSFNGCPMKADVRNGKWVVTTNFIQHTNSNGSVVMMVVGMEMDLLWIVLQQINMTLVLVSTRAGPLYKKVLFSDYVYRAMNAKEVDVALGDLALDMLLFSYFDCTNTYYVFSVSWYVPCFVKYPRWSSIFRILSVELWLVLIISIVIAAISTTLIGRYSCTSEWQGYKTLTSSLTNIWAVILGVSVSTKPRTPSLRSLFFAWVCFSLAFSTGFQAFLTTFLIDSGYKTPIRNMDDHFASGIKLVYNPEYSSIFENGDKTEASNIKRNSVNCPSREVCVNWAKYNKNLSVLLADDIVEENLAFGTFVGENSKPMLCRLKDVLFRQSGLTMIMLHGDPLMRRVTEIIDRVVEAGIYNYWISLRIHWLKLLSRKTAIVHPFDGYYSFNLYHLQPAFYLLLMGWCLSALCFFAEILYKSVSSKRN